MTPAARKASKTPTTRLTAGHAAWLPTFTQSLTSTTRALHSMRLYSEMVRRAGVPIRPNLFTVLTRIGELQPARVSDVAENTGYDPSTVSRQVADLVQLGYITRVRDDNDGRAVVLRVTTSGQQTITAVFDAWQSFLGEITADWKAGERDVFLQLLQRFGTTLVESVDAV